MDASTTLGLFACSAGANPPTQRSQQETVVCPPCARADLRHLPICSVDPPGCKDIDDALHVRPLPNGNYELGEGVGAFKS